MHALHERPLLQPGIKCRFALAIYPFNNSLFTFKKCIIALFYRAYFLILYIISVTSLGPTPIHLI